MLDFLIKGVRIIDGNPNKSYIGDIGILEDKIITKELNNVKYKELIDDKSYLEGVLRSGAEAAQQRAYKVLIKVYRKAGFVERPR